jgi:hypothetical protein
MLLILDALKRTEHTVARHNRNAVLGMSSPTFLRSLGPVPYGKFSPHPGTKSANKCENRKKLWLQQCSEIAWRKSIIKLVVSFLIVCELQAEASQYGNSFCRQWNHSFRLDYPINPLSPEVRCTRTLQCLPVSKCIYVNFESLKSDKGSCWMLG